MKVKARQESLRLLKPFGISRGTKLSAEVIRVSISKDGITGFGEAVPYPRYGETTANSISQIIALPAEFDRKALVELLPAGASRNALDAALWDLESKEAGIPVWRLAGFESPVPLPMGYTVSLKHADEMTSDAEAHSEAPLLKIKLGGDDDAQIVSRIRQAAPMARLIVDANEGWSISQFEKMIPFLLGAGVEMVEQPLPSSQDHMLAGLGCPIPLCADESYEPGSSLTELSDAYSVVNLKLDKSGGLTSAIKELKRAGELGIGVMVGCMVGSSLSMAPAFLLAQRAKYSDLDGFLNIESDTPHPIIQDRGTVLAPEALWGYPASNPGL
jgi:L-alanine-DL-glutamate epimerase-like enolase superfamily enzyme